mgnify:CR=1 FL=1
MDAALAAPMHKHGRDETSAAEEASVVGLNAKEMFIRR